MECRKRDQSRHSRRLSPGKPPAAYRDSFRVTALLAWHDIRVAQVRRVGAMDLRAAYPHLYPRSQCGTEPAAPVVQLPQTSLVKGYPARAYVTIVPILRFLPHDEQRQMLPLHHRCPRPVYSDRCDRLQYFSKLHNLVRAHRSTPLAALRQLRKVCHSQLLNAALIVQLVALAPPGNLQGY